jgi:hypothetical protein
MPLSGGVAIEPLQGAGGPGLLRTSFAAWPSTFEWRGRHIVVLSAHAHDDDPVGRPTPTRSVGRSMCQMCWSTGTIAPDQMGLYRCWGFRSVVLER